MIEDDTGDDHDYDHENGYQHRNPHVVKFQMSFIEFDISPHDRFFLHGHRPWCPVTNMRYALTTSRSLVDHKKIK